MKLLIKNGRIVNPANNLEETFDILSENGIIKKIEKNITENSDVIINAKHKIVIPGLIDVHSHFRDPGETHKEDIISGCKAAETGGFTSIVCMANTNPVIDNEFVIKYIIDKAKKFSKVNIFPVASITKGMLGNELTEVGKLKKFGIVGISDDGKPVENASILRNSLLYSKMFNIPLFSHCERLDMTSGTVMNEGIMATSLGLIGAPNVSESAAIAADILIAESVNSKIHICHVSTKESVEIIRIAKKKGIKVTCETAPHYFSLTDEMVRGYNTNAKVNPPLRDHNDVLEIIKGLSDGTIDIIASDHAPHHEDDKNLPFCMAKCGIIGLETSLAIGMTFLVKKEKISLMELIKKMTLNPNKLINVDRGSIEVGKVSDITIFDEKEKWIVDAKKIKSKSKNSPFIGFELYGKVKYTIAAGEIIYKDD
ncbi:MAG: dihydroorotase [Clostridiales bacterium]|jgi:dihydroorotase|nr:dihydroorotase [Clostridiales bacterium]